MITQPSTLDQVWIIIAAYNEGNVIGGVVRPLVEAGYHVAVVNDGSRDATALRAHGAGATVLDHAINRGQGAALQTGIRYALGQGAQIVITFDGDGQHCAEDVPRLIGPIREGRADIVLGSRFLEEDTPIPMARRILLRMAIVFTNTMSGVRFTDAHNGLRAFSSRAAQQLDLRLDRMAHASEIIDQIKRTSLQVMEVPVEVNYTPYSVTKGQRTGDAARIAWDYLLNKLFS